MMLYLYAAKHYILKVYIWTSNSYKSYAQIIGYVINSQQNQIKMGWDDKQVVEYINTIL